MARPILFRSLSVFCLLLATYDVSHAEITFLNATARGSFGGPTGIAITPVDEVYVADLNNNRVRLLDDDGVALGPVISTTNPRGIAVGPAGIVYVADRDNNRIQVYNSDGQFQLRFGSLGTGDGQFNQPLGVGAYASDEIFVADSINNRIQRFRVQLFDPVTGSFDPTADFLDAFGSLGAGESQFNAPTDVVVSPLGEVYVADRANNRIQKLEIDGTFDLSFGQLGSGAGQFNAPSAVALSAAGHLYVADRDNDRVQRFDPDGVFQLAFGVEGTQNGQFNAPRGVGVSRKGLVYVADSDNNRIQRFFDPDSWVFGRNEFITAANEPTSAGVGSRQALGEDFGIALGLVLTLDAARELVVGDTTRIAADGILTIAGGELVTGKLTGDGRFIFESGRLEINGEGIGLGNGGPLGDTLTVGFQSEVRSSSAITLGVAGDSWLEIRDGGTVSTASGVIAAAQSARAVARVTGPGSAWTNTGSLVVGDRGTGSLEIADAGQVSSASAMVGSANGGDGTVAVFGFGSEWINTGPLGVGARGDGLLTIRQGGIVRSGAVMVGSVGGVGNVVVEGVGSTLNSTDSVSIGSTQTSNGGRGSMVVIGGAQMTVGKDLSVEAGSSLSVAGGQLSVVGELNNRGEIWLDDTLSTRISSAKLNNFGLMSGGARLESTLVNASSGEIRVDADDRLTITGSNNTNSGTISIRDGAIQLSQAFTNNADGEIFGRGTLSAGGGWTNRGLMTFSGGQTDVDGNFLNTGGNALLLSTGGGTTTFLGNVTNSSGGEIRVSEGSFIVFLGSFNGGTTGEGTAIVEGVLSPGNSPAAVSFGGDLVFRSRATAVFELGGTVAGDEYDQVSVGAAASLAGTLQMETIDGYSDPRRRGEADAFLLIDTQGGRMGTFATVTYDGVQLEPTVVIDDGSFRVHQGDGFFRNLTYSADSVEFVNYLALDGDADGDLQVQFNDFVTLSEHFGDRGGWTDGDFDGDGVVQFSDFVLLSENFGQSVSPVSAAAVPEPATLPLAAMALLAPLLRRRRVSSHLPPLHLVYLV